MITYTNSDYSDAMFYMLYPTKTIFHTRTDKDWTDSQNDYKSLEFQ